MTDYIGRFIVVYDPHFSSDTPRSRIDDYPETMFTKLNSVLEFALANDCEDVIFTGDFSHKKTQPTHYEYRMITELNKFWEQGIDVWSIVGNHDVYAANPEHLPKTFLGVLFASGALKRLTRITLGDEDRGHYEIHGWDYSPRLVVADPIKRSPGVWQYIAVAHGFLCKEQGVFEADDYLDRSSFQRAGYDALFVGHDHLEYPTLSYTDEQGRPMIVARGGALSRGTKHHYNRLRTPKVHLVTVRRDGIEVFPIAIPCLPGSDIFSDHRIEREDLEKNIKRFIGELKEAKMEQGDIFASLRQVCSDFPTLEMCFKYLTDAGFVEQ